MHPDDVPKTPEEIDRIISAEIPHPDECPELHELVKKKMMHGPCEGYNLQSPCLLNPKKRCEKEFPKHCQEFTTMTEDGVTTYRRRTPEQGGRTVEKKIKGKTVQLSNKWVVPYNKWLLLKYGGHINVEFVNTVKSVKYIYKYILKGPDKCHVEIIAIGADGKTKSKNIDEIKTFRQGRYYDSTQSTHRLLGFSMSHTYPPVQKLAFHLENEQIVCFDKSATIDEDLLQKYEKTQLIQWFMLNQKDPRANHLLYDQILQFYRWDDSNREWKRRKENRFKGIKGPDDPLSDAIGRIPVVGLNHYQREKFFLRLLLHHVPGAKSFQDLRTVETSNGQTEICGTFQDACIKLNLTENDQEAEDALNQAFDYSSNDRILKHFYVMLMIHQMAASPWTIFQKFKSQLCSDQMYKARPEVDEPTDEMVNNVLLELKALFELQDKDMADFIGKENMPTEAPKEKVEAQEYQTEVDFDTDVETEKAEKNEVLLNKEQKVFVQTILEAAGVFNGEVDESKAKGKNKFKYLKQHFGAYEYFKPRFFCA